jgi:hypothetical protein
MAEKMNLSIIIRDNTYVKKKIELEKPVAFISHDTRDKEQIAYPLAIELQKKLCPVWFDEFSLKVGDSLCESIDRGIKETQKCILILSQNFLNNNGWTKEEFRQAFTKERINQDSIILPIWVDVTKEQIYNYHATLADKFAIKWDSGLENVVNKLLISIK